MPVSLIRRIPLLILMSLLILPLAVADVPDVQAQPLNEFFELNLGDPMAYENYQMKFTFLGVQIKNVPSFGVTGVARPFDVAAFDPWEVDYDYSNDRYMGDVIVLNGMEWLAFMDRLAMEPHLTTTDRIPEPNCSIMIQTDIPATMCWEHMATDVETDQIFQFLEDAVVDPAMKETVARFRRQMAGVRR